jgi:2-polyprenyl-6-hydroxyphenyl methylase/3-demethylubiquinone-9 3-methyltransferase
LTGALAQDDGRVSAAEIARFGALAPQWWDTSGPMRELHAMNPLRVRWVADRIRGSAGGGGLPVLDLGCGGGIATEALAREGFAMTGVDGSAEAIGVARTHAAAAGLAIEYETGLAEDVLASGRRFAAVTALEIIEHVPDPAAFLATLRGLLVPGGMLFVSTMNRTLRSLAVAKIGAEYVVRLLPAGTHDWRKFVKPDELAGLGRQAGLRLVDVSGMVRGAGGWREAPDLAINYIAALVAGGP